MAAGGERTVAVALKRAAMLGGRESQASAESWCRATEETMRHLPRKASGMARAIADSGRVAAACSGGSHHPSLETWRSATVGSFAARRGAAVGEDSGSAFARAAAAAAGLAPGTAGGCSRPWRAASPVGRAQAGGVYRRVIRWRRILESLRLAMFRMAAAVTVEEVRRRVVIGHVSVGGRSGGS